MKENTDKDVRLAHRLLTKSAILMPTTKNDVKNMKNICTNLGKLDPFV